MMKPIGFVHSTRKLKLEAPRQGALDRSKEIQRIALEPGQNFEQALEDLGDFSHVWLISQFHLNDTWNTKVKPPRGSKAKRGVFATRSPYRPNQIGLSCVELVEIKGRNLWVTGSDLLDGTPILDIKPYVVESDSFPNASIGWMENRSFQYEIIRSPQFLRQIDWLDKNGLKQFDSTIVQQLERNPLDSSSKRVKMIEDGLAVFAYRTWRVIFKVGSQTLELLEIRSGYSPQELLAPEDKCKDKNRHRDFIVSFGWSADYLLQRDS